MLTIDTVSSIATGNVSLTADLGAIIFDYSADWTINLVANTLTASSVTCNDLGGPAICCTRIHTHTLQAFRSKQSTREAAAVSEQRFQQLVDLLKGHNFEIKEQGDIYYANDLNYGWKLVAERG